HLLEIAAELVTTEFWLKVGHEDAKALEYYRSAGNEIIELDESVQKQTKVLADEWASAQAQENEWFAKVWDSQQAYETLWKDASRYRNVKR
ncbi:MAG: C4-dicarboxylate ABC transporter substrate-binding protein, partial [Candidatus Competibacteraceae bacterium]|nr:C4-dicarboxylate ABC transporter substrate-binding protein [Candidatus Competibacteraceae bacterium]